MELSFPSLGGADRGLADGRAPAGDTGPGVAGRARLRGLVQLAAALHPAPWLAPPAAADRADGGRAAGRGGRDGLRPLGLPPDPESGRRRTVWALIVVWRYSRHCFVWPTTSQRLDAVVEGLEAAWACFEGVPRYLVIDNFPAAVAGADALHPRFTRGFLEYARHRGFITDPARVRRPRDKPRVERSVPYVRERFFKGADFRDLAGVGDRGLRSGTASSGRPALVPGGGGAAHPRDDPQRFFKGGRARGLRGGGAPGPRPVGRGTVRAARLAHGDGPRRPPRRLPVRALLGAVRALPAGAAGRAPARLEAGAHLPPRRPDQGPSAPAARRPRHRPQRLPGRAQPLHAACARPTQAARGRTGRGGGQLRRAALRGPLPWAKLRQGHKLLRLAERYSPARLDAACLRALEVDLIDVRRLERILVEALEQETTPQQPPGPPPPGRFARPGAVFALTATQTPTGAPR